MLASAPAIAQEPDVVPIRDARPSEPTGETVTIHREALRLIDPQPYFQPLHLAPARELSLAATRLGTVRVIRRKVDESLDREAVAVEFDATELDLRLRRAEADLKVAEIELEQAKAAGQKHQISLAQARLAAATAGHDLAQHQREQALIRAPFAGTVTVVHVREGQVVRPGDPLVTIADLGTLAVEVPIDRRETVAGKMIELRIEDQNVSVTVDSVRPLARRFDELRGLIPSVASALVLLNNAEGKFHNDQAVYAPLVPRSPITEVPNGSLSNMDAGGRKVQVVRDSVVRDIQVTVLGSIGDDRSFVSGPFRAGDELILSLSKPLADGQRVRPLTELADSGPPGRRRARAETDTADTVNDALRGLR
jgi:multidrug efflux pump subunit AcrA (membrane-fusion protein)